MSDRVRYTHPIRVPQNTGFIYDQIYSKLTVMNVQRKDEGVYRCMAITHDGKNNTVDKLVYVIEGKMHGKSGMMVKPTLSFRG